MYELYASKTFVTVVKYKNNESKKRRKRIISSSFSKTSILTLGSAQPSIQ
jgi:hypothetical protein